MQDDIIELIQPTPIFKTKKCLFLVHLIRYTLQYLHVGLFLVGVYMYDFIIGFVFLAITYIIVGIIRSKLRIVAIPPSQLELSYDDFSIASWYAYKYLCYENIEKS
jgi:hypothetical protein